MFDIGFWEMVVIAVVALLVIGPKELPALIRGVSTWMSRARRVAGEFKAEFTREVAKAEEIKRLVEREAEIAEVHKALDEARTTISLDGTPAEKGKGDARESGAGGDALSEPAVTDTTAVRREPGERRPG